MLVTLAIPVHGQDASPEIALSTGWAAATEVRPAGDPAVRSPAEARPRAPRTTRKAAPKGGRSPLAAANAVNAVLGHRIDTANDRTTVHFELGGPTEVAARSLANPPRVIIDLAEMEFRLPPGAGQRGGGLVNGFRFGLISAGRSRIVLDTSAPARVERADVVLTEATGAFRLEIELAATTERELAAIEMAEAALLLKPTIFPQSEAAAALPRPQNPARPVIVVDAGHGGIDSGASGARVAEKDLVLSVARQIERALQAERRYDVVMTRTRDVFVSLDERVAISRQHNADLFLSVHADSLPSREAAKGVRGATVYTLAEHASDDLTRRVADNENAVDLLAGLPASAAEDDQVRDILLDLMRRESLAFATGFRSVLLQQMASGVLLSRDPRRSGPFKVLKQPGSPAVLVELGYISNAEDEQVMLKPDWQAKLATAVVRAVDEHFRQRVAGGR